LEGMSTYVGHRVLLYNIWNTNVAWNFCYKINVFKFFFILEPADMIIIVTNRNADQCVKSKGCCFHSYPR
jgi:hypothetical protein